MRWKPQDTFLKLLSRKEKVLFFISSLLVVVAALSLFLFRENDQGNQNSLQLQKIGSIEFTGLDVKRKSLGEADFKDSSNKDSLFQKDTLYVGPGSRAKIILPEYGNFELEPNAVVLVVLDFEKLNVDKNDSTKANSKARGLKLKLIQGKLKFEAKKPVAGKKNSTPSPEDQTQIRIEIADNTVLELGDQKELSIEKKKEGGFRVLSSSTKLRAIVSSADASQSPKEIIVPPNQDLSALVLTKNTQDLNMDLTSQGLKNEIISNMAHVASLTDQGQAVPEARNESFFRWGAKSGQATEHSEEIKEILSEYSATKAGNVELGSDESGGKYFHFYVPNEKRLELEEKIASLLGTSFYKEQVNDRDSKSRFGNSRVVFVLFEVAAELADKAAANGNNISRKPSSEESQVPSYYHSWSEYGFSLKSYYSSMRALDKSSQAFANFYSKQNVRLDAEWNQNWTNRYSTKLGFDIRQESWDQGLSPNRTLSNKSYVATGFLVGGAYHLRENLELSSFVAMEQEAFLLSKSSGAEIVFDTPSVFNLDFGAKKQFHLTDEYYFDLSLNGFSILPKSTANYKIRFSPGYKIGASLKQIYRASFLEAQLFWDYQKLNSSIVETTRSNFGLSITYGFGSDPNKKEAP